MTGWLIGSAIVAVTLMPIVVVTVLTLRRIVKCDWYAIPDRGHEWTLRN